MTEWEKMVSGQPYDAYDPDLKKLRQEARILTGEMNRLDETEIDRRYEILRELFGSMKNQAHIEPPFHCDYGKNIHVGKNLFINFNCVILDVAPVTIGDNCWIAPNVGIYTAEHPLERSKREAGIEMARPIKIGDGCWIGGSAVINPGVTLGNNVVVASGAVVTKSFGDNVVLAGVPARVIKALEDC